MKEPTMECPAEKMKKDENYKRVMLVAAGSAMATGCEPRLNIVIPNLIEVGVSDAEIRGAVDIGQTVNQEGPTSGRSRARTPVAGTVRPAEVWSVRRRRLHLP